MDSFSHVAEVQGATSVDHCAEGRVLELELGQGHHRFMRNVVVARRNLLSIYTIKWGGSVSPADEKLELYNEYALADTIESVQCVRFPGATTDSIMLSFHEAKVSVVDVDPSTRELVLVSLHQFESRGNKGSRAKYFTHPAVVPDPDGKCAAMIVYDTKVAIMPFADSSMEGERSEGKASSPISQSYVIDFASLNSKFKNIKDIAFLHNYHEPTLLILYDRAHRWEGRVAGPTDTCSVAAISLNLSQRLHPVIWEVDGLPFSSFKIMSTPNTAGGAIVFSNNILMFVNQSSVTGLSVNGHSALEGPYRFDIQETPYAFNLFRVHFGFLNSSCAVLSTLEGDWYLLDVAYEHRTPRLSLSYCSESSVASSLTVVGGRYVFIGSTWHDSVLVRYTEVNAEALSVEQAESAAPAPIKRARVSRFGPIPDPPVKVEALAEDLDDQMELYGPGGIESSVRQITASVQNSATTTTTSNSAATTNTTAAPQRLRTGLHSSFVFEVADSLLNVGAAVDLLVAPSVNEQGEEVKLGSEPIREFIGCSGHGSLGSVFVAHTGIRPQLSMQFGYPSVSGLFALRLSEGQGAGATASRTVTVRVERVITRPKPRSNASVKALTEEDMGEDGGRVVDNISDTAAAPAEAGGAGEGGGGGGPQSESEKHSRKRRRDTDNADGSDISGAYEGAGVGGGDKEEQQEAADVAEGEEEEEDEEGEEFEEVVVSDDEEVVVDPSWTLLLLVSDGASTKVFRTETDLAEDVSATAVLTGAPTLAAANVASSSAIIQLTPSCLRLLRVGSSGSSVVRDVSPREVLEEEMVGEVVAATAVFVSGSLSSPYLTVTLSTGHVGVLQVSADGSAMSLLSTLAPPSVEVEGGGSDDETEREGEGNKDEADPSGEKGLTMAAGGEATTTTVTVTTTPAVKTGGDPSNTSTGASTKEKAKSIQLPAACVIVDAVGVSTEVDVWAECGVTFGARISGSRGGGGGGSGGGGGGGLDDDVKESGRDGERRGGGPTSDDDSDEEDAEELALYGEATVRTTGGAAGLSEPSTGGGSMASSTYDVDMGDSDDEGKDGHGRTAGSSSGGSNGSGGGDPGEGGGEDGGGKGGGEFPSLSRSQMEHLHKAVSWVALCGRDGVLRLHALPSMAIVYEVADVAVGPSLLIDTNVGAATVIDGGSDGRVQESSTTSTTTTTSSSSTSSSSTLVDAGAGVGGGGGGNGRRAESAEAPGNRVSGGTAPMEAYPTPATTAAGAGVGAEAITSGGNNNNNNNNSTSTTTSSGSESGLLATKARVARTFGTIGSSTTVVSVASHVLGSRLYLFVFTSANDLFIYEAFAWPNPTVVYDSEGKKLPRLNLRFRRVQHSVFTAGYMAPPTRFGSDCCRTIPFENVSGQSGVFIPGPRPLWVLSVRSSIKVFSQTCDGEVTAWTPFCNYRCSQGFIYTDGEFLKIAALSSLYSYENALVTQKVPLDATPVVMGFHEPTLTAVVAVSEMLPRQRRVVKQEEFQGNPLRTYVHELVDVVRGPVVKDPQFTVRLYSGGWWKWVDSFELEEDEHVLCMKVLHVRAGANDARRDLVILGTCFPKGEETTMNGRCVVLDVVKIVPEPGKPWTGHKLKLLAQKEMRGAVTAVSEVAGFIIVTAGFKCFGWEYNPGSGDLEERSFHDTQVLSVSCSVVRHFLLLADVNRGLWLLQYRPFGNRLSLLSKDYDGMNVTTSEFMVDGAQLRMIAVDEEKNVHVFALLPDHPDSHGGRRLLAVSDIHVGTNITRLFRVLAPPVPTWPPPSKDARAAVPEAPVRRMKVQVHSTVYCGGDGCIGAFTPVSEQVFKRLVVLQAKMTTSLQHYGGCNPRAYRTVKSTSLRKNVKRNILDGALLRRYLNLDEGVQRELARMAGSTRDTILGNLAYLYDCLHFTVV